MREFLTAGPEAIAAAKALIPSVWGRPLADAMPITAAAIAGGASRQKARKGCGRSSKSAAAWLVAPRDTGTKDTKDTKE